MSMLVIDKINKVYNQHGSETTIFEDFSITFDGNRHCLSAPNGTGKSTLLCIIAGVESYQGGSIQYDGERIEKILHSIAICSDSIVMPGFLTANQVFLLNQKMFSCDFPHKLIAGFNFTEHLHKPIGTLSAGNLKKLQLINALMREPSILLADEPNIALDDKSLNYMWEIFNSFAGMLLVASNEPDIYAKRQFKQHQLHQEELMPANSCNTGT